MPRTIYKRTSTTGPNGEPVIYEPGDEVPDDVAERIDNPTVWERPDGDESPLGSSDGAADVPRPPADAPYATPGGIAPFQPDSGPVTEEGSTELTGEPAPAGTAGGSSARVRTDGSKPSPEELDRMTRAQLDEVAASLGIDPSGAHNKDEVRSLIDSADAPADSGTGY